VACVRGERRSCPADMADGEIRYSRREQRVVNSLVDEGCAVRRFAALTSDQVVTAALRLNAPGSATIAREAACLGALRRLDAVIMPKAERVEDVFGLRDGLAAVAGTRSRPVEIELLIETALGLLNVDTLAAVDPCVTALHLGVGDLAAQVAGQPALRPRKQRDGGGARRRAGTAKLCRRTPGGRSAKGLRTGLTALIGGATGRVPAEQMALATSGAVHIRLLASLKQGSTLVKPA